MAKKKKRGRYVDEEGECIICGFVGVDLHHVKSRGAHGIIDEPWNLMPLCHEHHVMVEYQGLPNDSDDVGFQQITSWFKENGWEYDDFIGKWFHV